MSTDKSAAAAKVRKLRALANDPAAAPNEAATAKRQADATAAKHGLDDPAIEKHPTLAEALAMFRGNHGIAAILTDIGRVTRDSGGIIYNERCNEIARIPAVRRNGLGVII